jgi:hypothetical protein
MAAQEGENAPVILTAFASTEARQGESWKIFLQAEDRDGDMNRIVCTLEQPGGGPQPMSIIGIRDDRRRIMSGYIYLNIASPFVSPFATCRLTIQIQDKKGNLSNPFSFSLSWHPRAVQQTPPPGVFQDEDLGPVQIPFPSIPAP